jgi:hypothetical protein
MHFMHGYSHSHAFHTWLFTFNRFAIVIANAPNKPNGLEYE